MSTVELFFFNDTATTEIYTLSLHDALPISPKPLLRISVAEKFFARHLDDTGVVIHLHGSISDPWRWITTPVRSEEHTSELQSLTNFVCRLLLEKKKVKMSTVESIARTRRNG